MILHWGAFNNHIKALLHTDFFNQDKKSERIWLPSIKKSKTVTRERFFHHNKSNIKQQWWKTSRPFTRWVSYSRHYKSLLYRVENRLPMYSAALNHIGLDCIPVIDLFWTQFKIFQSPNFNHDCTLMTILVQSWQNHRRLHGALFNHD